MSLKDPSIILRAWVVAPLIVSGCSAVLGVLITRAAGRSAGALTTPLGFLGGIVLLVALMRLGFSGRTATICLLLLTLAGLVWLAMPLQTTRQRALTWARTGDTPWAAASALVGFLFAMAPLAGGGRAGVLGYVLNNDPSVHSSIVEALARHGFPIPPIEPASSFSAVGTLPNDGYPIGGHAWPVFAKEVGSVDAFFVWAPLIAVACAMLSLTAFAALRRFGAGRATAAIAASLIPAGYLVYSYVGQGSAKEIVTAVAVYATAVTVADLIESRAGPRALIAPGIGAAAALLAFGAGAGIWIAPIFVPLVVFGVWRLRSLRPQRRTVLLAVVVFAGLVAVAIAPVTDAIDYVNEADEPLRNPAQVGNLLGAVPWGEAFNIWFAYDYRIGPPTYETLSHVGGWVAAVLAVLGLIFAVRRGRWAIPLAVVAGAIGALVLSKRYAIYMDAKSYLVLAPALGLATAAGIISLVDGGRVLRHVGLVVGTVVAFAVLAGAYMVYSGAWLSPRERFEELADIADRFEGDGPIMVNDREEYGYYWLRDLAPFESWGSWQPRDSGFGPVPSLSMPHTPDFDDFTLEHVQQFPLLLERKGPGGSRPPANFEPVFETTHYRVWRRTEPAPVGHISLGVGTLDNVAPLDCGDPAAARVLAAAYTFGYRLVLSKPNTKTTLVVDPTAHWFAYDRRVEPPPPGMINRRGGVGVASFDLKRGSYSAWIQGSFGPGVSLRVYDQLVGAVHGDLGLPSQWLRLGEFATDGSPGTAVLAAESKPRWQSGNRRSDITGQLVVQPTNAKHRLKPFPRRSLRELCGQRLDWVEAYRD